MRALYTISKLMSEVKTEQARTGIIASKALPARYLNLLQQAEECVWREFSDGLGLRAWIFSPQQQPLQGALPVCLVLCNSWSPASHPADMISWALHAKERGAVAILLEYRSLGEYAIDMSHAMDDACEAWYWLWQNRSELGIDLQRSAIIAGGTGAFLALHVNYSLQQKLALEPVPPPRGLCLLGGWYDSSPKSGVKSEWFASPLQAKQASCLSRVCGGLADLLVFHGKKDLRVDYRQAQRLVQAWKRKKNTAHCEILPTSDHQFYYFNLDSQAFEYVVTVFDDFATRLGIFEMDPTNWRVLS